MLLLAISPAEESTRECNLSTLQHCVSHAKLNKTSVAISIKLFQHGRDVHFCASVVVLGAFGAKVNDVISRLFFIIKANFGTIQFSQLTGNDLSVLGRYGLLFESLANEVFTNSFQAKKAKIIRLRFDCLKLELIRRRFWKSFAA